jgi:membrane glycosyltransferase
MAEELALGLLLETLEALERTLSLLRLARGRFGGWAPQPRAAREVTWAAAARRFGWHTAAGLAMAGGFGAAGGFALLAALPALAGLLLAVPLAVLTARPGARARRQRRCRARKTCGRRRAEGQNTSSNRRAAARLRARPLPAVPARSDAVPSPPRRRSGGQGIGARHVGPSRPRADHHVAPKGRARTGTDLNRPECRSSSPRRRQRGPR